MLVRTTAEPPIPVVAAVGSPSRLNGARRIHFCIYMVKFIKHYACPGGLHQRTQTSALVFCSGVLPLSLLF